MISPLILASLASSDEGRTVSAVTFCTDTVRVTGSHHHARGQLLGALKGLLTIEVRSTRWIVPSTHAVWIPPEMPHAMRSHGQFSGWSLYVTPSACNQLPAEPRVLQVSGLLREAIGRAALWTNETDGRQTRLMGVILDEIIDTPATELGLPLPKDARLLRIAKALSDRPNDPRRLSEWADWAGIAPRTLNRHFLNETGFSFREWRQRVRLLRALELLAIGKPIKTIALELGYANVSAFINVFRRVFGTTPGKYQG